MELKSNRREFAHTKELSGDGRASEQLTLAEIRELYIVYNSHVTCSNSSFSLAMVTPTSHVFAFHWLCSLLPIGYLPKPGSVGVRICHHHGVKVIFRYLGPDVLVSTSTVFTALVGMWDISAITLLKLSRRRKTLNSKPVKLRLKNDLVSYPARAEGLVNSTLLKLSLGGCSCLNIH